MPGAPMGNQNAVGNRGGGRKSAYEEEAAARMVLDAFLEGLTLEDIKRITRLMKGEGEPGERLKLMESALVRSIKSDRLMQSLLDKILPSKLSFPGGGNGDSTPEDDEKAVAIDSLIDAMRNGNTTKKSN